MAKDKYGIPLDKHWRDVRMQDIEDNKLVGEPMNLMDWQAHLQTELGKVNLENRVLKAERDALRTVLFDGISTEVIEQLREDYPDEFEVIEGE